MMRRSSPHHYSRDLSASKRKIAPTSLLPELRGTFAARELLENLWQTTSLKAVVCAIRFAIDSQAYRSPKASAIADRAGLPLARRLLHGSWLSVVISLLLPVTLCGFAHRPRRQNILWKMWDATNVSTRRESGYD
jgi:hypothetical protein